MYSLTLLKRSLGFRREPTVLGKTPKNDLGDTPHFFSAPTPTLCRISKKENKKKRGDSS